MSIYGDYEHSILHHQTEREVIRDAEQRRLLRETRGEQHGPRWRGLFQTGHHRQGRRSRGQQVRPTTQPATR